MQPKNFKNRKKFPGNTGTNFDLILGLTDIAQRMPAPLFGFLLAGIALLASRLDLVAMAILASFYLADWLLLALLPHAGKSFGPARPPTLMLALLRAPFALLPYPWWIAIELVGTALVIYGFWFEPHRLTLTRQSLQSPKLGFERPLRLLHLGDIHVERLTRREHELIERVHELEPDLILFSGDFLNLSYTRDAVAAQHARSVLSQINAPLGVFAVSGSPAVDPPEVVAELLRDMPHIRWLRGESVSVKHEGKTIEIVGLDCTHRPFIDGPKMLTALNGYGPDTFRVLLYHTPDLAPEAARAGIDLQLSGHTHGGQIRLPLFGALYAGSLYGKAFESGRRQIGGLTLYVSRGIGLEGGGAPRVRFNCPPEIILWQLS